MFFEVLTKSSPYLESLQSDLASVHFHGDMCTGDPSIHESRAASWQWQLNRGLFSSSNGDSWNLSPENTPKKKYIHEMNLKREKNHVRVGIKLKSETNTTQQDIPMVLAPASNLNVIKKIQIFHMYT